MKVEIESNGGNRLILIIGKILMMLLSLGCLTLAIACFLVKEWLVEIFPLVLSFPLPVKIRGVVLCGYYEL
ncbi:MAG TPA: hypothetical protein PLE69_02820 [bacterium]|jgi:hypothetical protein|nr:hypothetical protein [bacterium]